MVQIITTIWTFNNMDQFLALDAEALSPTGSALARTDLDEVSSGLAGMDTEEDRQKPRESRQFYVC